MRKKKKPTIKKLKYPLWFYISFYVLTLVIPVITIMVQGFRSPSQIFRITFGSICIILLLWSFVRKFILANVETKLLASKAALEHDYEIDVGNSRKTKYVWYTNEIWLALINIIQVMLIGALILVLLAGLEAGAIKIKGATYLVAICYLSAYILKFSFILTARNKEYEEDEVQNEREQPKQ